jgi:uncharacterized protein (TIGR03435 family)
LWWIVWKRRPRKISRESVSDKFTPMHKYLLLVCAAVPLWAQGDTFESASVRVAKAAARGSGGGGSRMTGGPGTEDPEHLRYTQVPMMEILPRAFQMQLDQIEGPDWVTDGDATQRFDITANIRPGATKEQVEVMLQNLLKEQFHLTYHLETKDIDVYDLVPARAGAKLQDAEIPAESPSLPNGPLAATPGEDGFPKLAPGWPMVVGLARNGGQFFMRVNAPGAFVLVNPRAVMTMANWGLVRFSFRMVTVEQLMGALQTINELPHVVDRTGLTGTYDVKIGFSQGGGVKTNGEASEPAPDIFTALEKQLGLRLQKAKAELDVMVIDHIDPTPTPAPTAN